MKKLLNSIKNMLKEKDTRKYDMCKNMEGEFKEYCYIGNMKHII